MFSRYLLLTFTGVTAFAQSASVGPSTASPESDLRQRLALGQARAEIVAAVHSHAASPDEALTRLKTQGLLKREGRSVSDADTAAGAVDLALRFLAVGEDAAADKFFRVAEGAYEQALRQIPDSEPAQQARTLQNLAWVRSTYLGKPAEAETNLRRAAELQPKNARLQRKVKELDDAQVVMRERNSGKQGRDGK